MKFAYAVEIHAATEGIADIALRTALGRMSQEWIARSEPRLEIGDVAYADALRRNLAVSNAPEGPVTRTSCWFWPTCSTLWITTWASSARRACRTTYEGLHAGSVTRMVSEQLFGLS